MPKSKRNKQVELAKTKKHGLEGKKALYEQIRSCVDTYAHIFVFSVNDMRNSKMKTVREQWKHSRFFIGKNKVMAIALGRSPEEEYRPNLHKIGQALKGPKGLLFSNQSIEDVISWFRSYSEGDYARSGNVATENVNLHQGPLSQFPHNLEPYLRQLGLPTTLVKGVVHLVKDHEVCKLGDTLTPETAKILKLLGYEMAEFNIKIESVWSQDGSYTDFESSGDSKENIMNNKKVTKKGQKLKDCEQNAISYESETELNIEITDLDVTEVNIEITFSDTTAGDAIPADKQTSKSDKLEKMEVEPSNENVLENESLSSLTNSNGIEISKDASNEESHTKKQKKSKKDIPTSFCALNVSTNNQEIKGSVDDKNVVNDDKKILFENTEIQIKETEKAHSKILGDKIEQKVSIDIPKDVNSSQEINSVDDKAENALNDTIEKEQLLESTSEQKKTHSKVLNHKGQDNITDVDNSSEDKVPNALNDTVETKQLLDSTSEPCPEETKTRSKVSKRKVQDNISDVGNSSKDKEQNLRQSRCRKRKVNDKEIAEKGLETKDVANSSVESPIFRELRSRSVKVRRKKAK